MELIGIKYGGSCSFDGCWWNCIVALTLFWNLLSLIWYNHTLEIHPLDMPPKTSPMYQVCFSKSWWLLRVSHPKILVQYIVNLKLPLGLKNPGGFVPVRMRHRVSRWIFFSSTPWRRRNALFLIMWLGRSGREKPCGHRGCWSFYNFLARGDVFKRVLLRKAKHSVSIGDQKETKLQRATIGLRKFDATF